MSLLARRLMPSDKYLVTYFGSASVPVDNTSSTASPMTITPPTNMRKGDLVFVHMFVGSAGPRTFSISVTGGQSWATLTGDKVGSNPEIYWTYCTFNGTWSANPQFSISGTGVSKSTVMHVFRPPYQNGTWSIDQQSTFTSNTATSSTDTGVTNTKTTNVTIAMWTISDGTATISSQTGTNWFVPGSTQYRNPAVNNKGGGYAYQIQGVRLPVGATGSVTKNWSTSLTSWRHLISFYYV